MSAPRTFISYSWDDDKHKAWVRELATSLRKDGVDVILDQWDVKPGDQLPAFMERAIRESDFVLIICTPKYKAKSDERSKGGGGGVVYEEDVIQGEVFTRHNHRKFIPILRRGNWIDSAPSQLSGKAYIGLQDEETFQSNYRLLLRTLHGLSEPIPELGRKPEFPFPAEPTSVDDTPLALMASAENFRKLADLGEAHVEVRMDPQFLYWPEGDFLARVPKEGGDVELVGRAGQFCEQFGSVAAEADGGVYWAGGNLVQRCPASGGKPEVLAQVPEFIRYFAITPTKIAGITDGFGIPGGGLVQVMPRSGGDIVSIAAGLKPSNFGGMVSDGEKLYWIESNTGTVMRGSADAKGFTVLCMNCGGNGLLQDKDHLYSRHGNSIMEISKETSKKPASSLAKGTFRELYRGPILDSMAVDSQFVYFTASDQGQQTGRIVRVDKTTKKTDYLVTQLNNPIRVFVDDVNVYFVDAGPIGKRGFITGIIGSVKKRIGRIAPPTQGQQRTGLAAGGTVIRSGGNKPFAEPKANCSFAFSRDFRELLEVAQTSDTSSWPKISLDRIKRIDFRPYSAAELAAIKKADSRNQIDWGGWSRYRRATIERLDNTTEDVILENYTVTLYGPEGETYYLGWLTIQGLVAK